MSQQSAESETIEQLVEISVVNYYYISLEMLLVERLRWASDDICCVFLCL